MKVCPACRTTFDDSHNFCLNDGTPLVTAETETETVVAAREPVARQPAGYSNLPPVARSPQPAPARSKTGLIVAATALLTILLVGAGAAVWWNFSRARSNQPAARNNTNLSLNSNAAPRVSPSAANNSGANANTTNSAVVLSNSANVQTTPTPAKQATSAETAEIREEAASVLNDWADALGSNNLNNHLSHYAETLDYYYNARGYGRNQVRADKQRAFAQFDSMEINVGNVRVTPDSSGERATVVYDKEWIFEGENKTNEGKTQSQLELRKIGGRWLIVGERDIKVYNQQSY